MGNIKCLNCGNEITMISNSSCPNCGIHLSHVKISFLSYLGAEDSLARYQRSYKLVLFRSIFEELLADTGAYVKAVVKRFKNFYLIRHEQGLMVDKQVDDVINNINTSSDKEIFDIIKKNPYKAISQHKFLSLTEDSIDGEFVLQKGIDTLTDTEKHNLISLMNIKLNLYYRGIGSEMAEYSEAEVKNTVCADDQSMPTVAITNAERTWPSLEELGFSTRSYNAIRRHRITSFEELVAVVDSGEIVNIKNLGHGSISEVLKIVCDVRDGNFFRDTTSSIQDNTQPQGNSDDIITYFPENKFASFRAYCDNNGITSISDLKNIEYSELMKIRGFGINKLNAIQARIEQITAETPDNDNTSCHLVDIKEFDDIDETNSLLSISVLRHFGVSSSIIKTLNNLGCKTFFDIKNVRRSKIIQAMGVNNFSKFEEALKTFESPLLDIVVTFLKEQEESKEFDIYLRRAEGDTFQEIGEKHDITRERVRQICLNFERTIMPMMLAIAQSLELENNSHYYKEDQVLSVFDNDDYDKIIVFALSNSDAYENVAGIFFNKEFFPNAEHDLIDIIGDIVGDGINLFDEIDRIERMLDEAGYGFISAENFLNIVIAFNYSFYGDFIVRDKKSYAFLCLQVVEKYFPDGIKYDDESLLRLRELTAKEYGNIELPESDRSLWTRLCTYLVQRGRSTYISPKKIFVDNDILQDIKQYIDDNPLNEIFFVELFAEFEGILMMTSNIDNPSFLHGVIANRFPLDYTYTRDSLIKSTAEEIQDLASRIRGILIDAGHPLKKDELFSHFAGIAESVLINAIIRSDDITQWEYNYYNCMGNITVGQNEIMILRNTLERLLDENMGYCSEVMLYTAVERKMPETFERNHVSNAQNLFYLAGMFLGDDFVFRRPHIARKGRFKSLNVKDILFELLGNPDRINYDDYVDLTNKCMIPVVTAGMVFTDIEKDYFRVSQNEYVRKDCISFDSADINALKEALDSSATDEWYLPIQVFADSEDTLPNGIQLNEFIVESLVNSLSLDWYIIQPQVRDRRYQKGILVHISHHISAYDQLISEIFKSKGISTLSESQFLSFMQIHRLAGKVIPKELLVSDYFTKDDNGIITVK